MIYNGRSRSIYVGLRKEDGRETTTSIHGDFAFCAFRFENCQEKFPGGFVIIRAVASDGIDQMIDGFTAPSPRRKITRNAQTQFQIISQIIKTRQNARSRK